MEVVNQFCARRTYVGFLKRMGVEAKYHEAILRNGYGYKKELSNLHAILEKYDISEDDFFNHFSNRILVNDYEIIFDNLVKFLKKRTKKNIIIHQI